MLSSRAHTTGSRAQLRDELVTSLATGRSPAVVIQGGHGMGKTRLLHELSCGMGALDRSTVSVTGIEGMSEIDFAAVAFLLPGPGDPDLPGPGATDLDRLQQALVRLRSCSRSPAGLLVTVDDAHLLDPASATVLAYAESLGLCGLALVVPDDAEAPQPLLGLIGRPGTALVSLGPMVHAELRELIDEHLAGPADGAVVAAVRRLCGGVPMLAVHILDEARSSGALVRRAGRWQLRGTGAATDGHLHLPGAATGLLDRLDPAARRALDLVALAEPVRLEALGRLVDDDVLQRLEAADLITLTEGPGQARVRPANRFYGDLARRRLRPLRRRLLIRELIMAHEAEPSQEAEVHLRVLGWRIELGETLDAERAAYGSVRALRWCEPALAARLAEAAAQAEPSFALGLVEAQARAALGQVERADRLFDRLAVGGDETQRVLAVVRRAMFGVLANGDASAVTVALGVARQHTTGLPAGFLRAYNAFFAVLAGDLDLAVAESDRILVDPGLPSGARALALSAQGWVAMTRGMPCVAIGLFARADAALRDTAGDAGCPLQVELVRGARIAMAMVRPGAEIWGGRPHRAAALLDEALAGLGDEEDLLFLMPVLWEATEIALLRGDTEVASAHCERVLALLRPAHLPWAAGVTSDLVLKAASMTGDLERAHEAADDLRAIGEGLVVPTTGETWYAAALGDLRVAAQLAVDAAELALATGHHLLKSAEQLAAAARWGRPEPQLMARLVAVGDSPVVAALAAEVEARVAGDRDALRASARALAALGLDRHAADASAAADRLVTAEPLETPWPLTPRERELGALVASGLSNREIADYLVISVRTVENHLHRVYTKLALGSRAELGRLARRWPREA